MPFAAPDTDEVVTDSTPEASPSSGFSAPKEDHFSAVEEAAKDVNFHPMAHAAQFALQDEEHPEIVFAHNVNERKKELGLPHDDEGSLWENVKQAPATVVKFMAGIPAAAALHGQAIGLGGLEMGFNLLDSATGSGPGPEGPHGPRPESWRPAWLDAAYEHAKNLSQISEAKALEPTRQLFKEGKVFGVPVLPAGYALPNADEKSLYKFTQAAKSAAIQQQLAKGTVPEQSALGTIDSAIGVDLPKEEPMSPWEQKVVDASSMTTDPMNLAVTALPSVPGSAQITKGAGRALEATGDAGLKALKVIKEHPGTATAIGAIPVAAEAARIIHNPEKAGGDALKVGGIAAALLAAKYGGKFLKETGQVGAGEAIPESGNAFTQTIAPVTMRARQGILGAVGGAETGAALGTANVLNNGADGPTDVLSKIGQPAANLASLGAAAGVLHSPRGAMEQNVNLNEEARGRQMLAAEMQTHPDLAQQTTDALASRDPATQAEFFSYKGRLQTKAPAQLQIVDGPTFAQMTGGSGGERGAYRDGTLFLNGDHPANQGAGILQPLKHELGHGLTTLDIADSVKNTLTPEEWEQAQKAYAKALLGHEPTPEEMAQVDVSGETIAEITRNILNGESLAKFGLPKPLTEKLADAAGQALQGADWLPDWLKPSREGDSSQMAFGTKNLTDTARRVRDALYQQGAEARGLRVQAQKGNPTSPTRIDQINARLTEIGKTARGDITPALIKERNDLIRERQQQEEGINAIAPAPTPAPVTPEGVTSSLNSGDVPPASPLSSVAPQPPSAQVSQTPLSQVRGDIQPPPKEPAPAPAIDREAIVKALVGMGIKKTEAKQWAAVAQGADTSAAIANALAQRTNQRTPTVAPQVPASTAPLASVTPAVETAEKPQPVPENGPTQTPEGGAVPASATPDSPLRSLNHPEDKGPAQVAEVPTEEAVAEALRQGETEAQAKAGRARSEGKKAEIVRNGRVDALKRLLAPDGPELHPVIDPDTKEVSFAGTINPENPAHAAILKEFGYGPKDIERLNEVQSRLGKAGWVRDYNSSKQKGFETGEGLDFSAEQRSKEYAASSAAERAAGTGATSKQDKPVTFLGMKLQGDGPNVVTFDHDKFLNNVRAVVDFARENGIPTALDGLKGEARDKALAKAVQDVATNHANGFKGDGSAPIQPFPDTGLRTNPDVAGIPVNPDLANLINMAMHNRSARPPEAPRGKTELAEAKFNKAVAKAKEAQGIAQYNDGFLNPETGETNPLREQMEKAGFDTDKTLKNTISNLRPDLMEGGIHDTPTHGKSVHAHGFDIDPQDLTAKGMPKAKIVSAGFMPDTGEPQKPLSKVEGKDDLRKSSQMGKPLSQVSQDEPLSRVGNADASKQSSQEARAQAVTEVEEQIRATKAERQKGVEDYQIETDEDQPEMWSVDHPEASGSWIVTQGENGKWRGEKDGSLTKEYATREEAIADARERVADEVNSARGAFGDNLDNTHAVAPIFEHFALPKGAQFVEPWFRTKWGSWYASVEMPDGNRLKLSVRDHDASRRDMGIPDYSGEVSKNWTPREVVAALDRVEKLLFKKANAEPVSESGAAGFKTEPSQAGTSGNVNPESRLGSRAPEEGTRFMPSQGESDPKEIARALGLKYDGELPSKRGLPFHQFTDPETGKSFQISGDLTAERVAARREEKKRTGFMPNSHLRKSSQMNNPPKSPLALVGASAQNQDDEE